MRKSLIQTLSILAASFILTGCVDDAFNLDKINDDMAITWETISAPIQDTDIIKVSEMFDFESNSSIVTTNEGDYHIYLSTNPTSTTFTVDKFTYEPAMKETHISEIPAKACDVEVEMTHGFSLNSSSIPSEVKSIERIEINCSVVPTFKFTKTESVNRIIMKKGSQLILPKWMVVGTYDESLLSAKDNVLTIIKDFDVTAEGMSSTLTISAIDFTKTKEGKATIKDGYFNLEDNVTTIGHVVLQDGDIVKKITESHYDISFRCDISSVEIKSVKALIDPQINMTIDDINISEFTSLFPKENTVNLYDIALNLDINNNSPLSTSFSADLESINNGSVLKTAHIGPASAKEFETSTIILSQRGENKVENLADIINSKPEKIAIKNIDFDHSEESVWIETGKNYSITTEYSVDAPIAFCKDLNYKFDHEMNLDVNLSNSSIESLVLTMDAENSIPIGLKMAAEVLDKEGKAISGVGISFDHDIQPGTLSAKSKTPIKIVIEPVGEIDYIKTLRIHFTGFNNEEVEGHCLNANQTLSLVNIEAKVNGLAVQLN